MNRNRQTTDNTLFIAQSHHAKILKLLSTVRPEIADLLENELNRASIVPDQELPKDVVSMNSKVEFQSLEDGKTLAVTLVYPNEADLTEGKISIFSPVGSALIGLRVGQSIHWPFPNGKEKQLKVISVS